MSAVVPIMNEPVTIAVLRAMYSRIIEFGVSPFVSLLSNLEIPDTTEEWLVEAQDFAGLILFNSHFHGFNCSFGDEAMLRPIGVALTLFVLFPVFAFSAVATGAGPSRAFAAKCPRSDSVPGDEGAGFWVRISVVDLVGLDKFECSLAIEAVLLVLSQ